MAAWYGLGEGKKAREFMKPSKLIEFFGEEDVGWKRCHVAPYLAAWYVSWRGKESKIMYEA